MANPGPFVLGGGGQQQQQLGHGPNPALDTYLARVPPQYLSEFRREQAVLNNFFAWHRAGLSTHAGNPWEDPNNPPPPPPGMSPGTPRPPGVRPGFWDGAHSTDASAAIGYQTNQRWLFRNMLPGPGHGHGHGHGHGNQSPAAVAKAAAANAAARAARRYLRASSGCGISLLGILGFGGNGVASLFEVDPGRGRARRKVVIKSLLRSGSGVNMKEEKGYGIGLKRARHIVQMVDWAQELIGLDGATIQDVARWAQIDGNQDIMTLEYMKNGDLWGFIKKLALAGQTVPNKVLWKIFICLIRACIAMRYPPRLGKAPNGLAAWASVVGPYIDEVIPGTQYPPRLELIHFDLDTKNILIGDFDDGEHKTAPTIKVSDLGLAKPVTHPDLDNPKGIWRARRRGKTQYLLPEQFHKEWEYINMLPRLEQPHPKVAGQFGAWSNIYAVALCMHIMITQEGPPYPPAAYGPMNTPAGDNLLVQPTVFTDYWNNRVRPFYTHGLHLEAEVGLDPQLRYLLMRCMADLPGDRPTPGELQMWALRKEAEPGWNDPNDGTRAWWASVLQSAPDPPSSAAQAHPSLATTAPARFTFDWAGHDPNMTMGQFSYSSGDEEDEDDSA